MVFKKNKNPEEERVTNKTVDFYMPANSCTTCQYRKEILISRERERTSHLPPPPDIKNIVRTHKEIEKEKIDIGKDKFIFGFWWNNLILRFMSKKFRIPFRHQLYTYYYSKDAEYISIFNLFIEVVKKNSGYGYFLKDIKQENTKQELKKVIESIQSPPQDMNFSNVTKDTENFISYSPLTKQDKIIDLISDEL
jgi:hypothetical protein